MGGHPLTEGEGDSGGRAVREAPAGMRSDEK